MSSEHVFEYGLEQLFQHRAICLRGENYAKMSEEDRKNVAIGFLLGDTQYPHARIKELEARAAAFVLYRESTHEMLMEHVQLQRRIKELEDGIRKVLNDNRGLADGDDCTLFDLKQLIDWN